MLLGGFRCIGDGGFYGPIGAGIVVGYKVAGVNNLDRAASQQLATTKIIASLGVLSYVQSVSAQRFGGCARQVDGILPKGTVGNVLGQGSNLA